MSNIVKDIQQALGYQSFDKIDPNIQQNKNELEQSSTTNHFNQAVTIGTLVGLYKFGTTEDGSVALTQPLPADLLQLFFRDKEEKAIEAVSRYGNQPYDATATAMQKAAHTALDILRNQVGQPFTPEKIRAYLAAQRHNILVFLPPDLEMGELLNDNSIDDRTNKMEGPVSNAMHTIESLLSGKDKSKEI